MERRLSRVVALAVARILQLGCRTECIDARRHELSLESWRSARVPGAGFVDYASFLVMHDLGIDRYLGFDHHFVLAGFEPLCGG